MKNALANLHSTLGASQLTADGALAVVNVVEKMHANIAAVSPPLGHSPPRNARGIAGFVYGCVRGTIQATGFTIEQALRTLEHAVAPADPNWLTDGFISALNGVCGDHLQARRNPLALKMEFRSQGRPIGTDGGPARNNAATSKNRLLILIHGLCMSDLAWLRQGHDHGTVLSEELGLVPVYLRYNSGRHISQNGQELAHQIESLVEEWPEPLEDVIILAHSMGGLVARSAIHHAFLDRKSWPNLLRSVVFLGTPHHGAPLERGGNWLLNLLDKSPYSSPIAGIGNVRSAGITDLSNGSLLEDDWRDVNRFTKRTALPETVPLPKSINCFAVAASLNERSRPWLDETIGDGLVPVASALGKSHHPNRDLGFSEENTWVGMGLNHLDLLNDAAVYRQIADWLRRD
ncbi:hypothetical protein [Pyruvatibacter sp.]|uniref:PGAP1-like alpha/beta domain-containing protein n=1 Tax=Pyruvatibacter sp. TaxID=1981328 RepID=UPI0032EEA446